MATHLENPERSGNLTTVWEIKKSDCGLPVACYCSFDKNEINITSVLLSKVDIHKMGLPIVPQYSLRSTGMPVCIPLKV